jgi:pimeloyl-ACP methyl ester carboxylesterase
MIARSQLLEVAGGRRTIEVFEAGEGEPFVFLHGEGGLAADSPFLSALAQGRRVFAPLLPGFGRSTGAEGLRDMLAVTLHSFDVLDALGLDRPVLVGHSLGGMIAAEMAALAPREVERLGLVAPMGLWLDAHPVPDLFATLPRELPGLLFHDPEFGERMMTAGRDLDDPKILEALVIGNARQLAMASKLLFPLPDRGLAERLYRVRAKTLVIWGEADRLVPPAYGDAFCRGIADAELITIPAAGHMVIVEQPVAVATALAGLGRDCP